MIRLELFRKLFSNPNIKSTLRHESQQVLDIQKLENDVENLSADEDSKERDLEIERKRNKSGLNPHHYNLVHDNIPYPEASHWSHGTLKYQRKMFGKYGSGTNFEPAYCWPTKEELSDRLEYERVAFPYTVPELMEMSRKARLEKEENKRLKQEQIVKNIEKLDTWKRELKARMVKKETEAKEAKDRKDRLIEDVRRHFGYKIDIHDEKFKELLEKREKEQKKLIKEARKKAKEEQMMNKLLDFAAEQKKAAKDRREAEKLSEKEKD